MYRSTGKWFLAALVALIAIAATSRAADEPPRPPPFDVRPACALAEARLACAVDEPGRRLEHLEVARTALEEATRKNAREARPRTLLSRVRLALNDAAGALLAAEEAAALAPDDAAARIAAGRAHLRLFDAASALDALHEAALHEPGPADIGILLRERARARLRAGDLAGARADAALALEREPSSADAEALVRWCDRRRDAGPLAEPEFQAGRAFAVATLVGEETEKAAVARLGALEAGFAALVGASPVKADRTPVHLVDGARYGKLAPEGGTGARAFYQRDEAAVFVLWEKPREAIRLLAHEASHALLHRAVEDAPAWLDEGLADVLAEDPHPVRLRDARVLLGAGKDVRLSEIVLLSRRAMYAPEGIHIRFAAAWGVVRWLRADDGDRLARILACVRAGGSPAEVTAAGFGDLSSLSVADRRWKAHVLALPERE